MKKKSVAFYEAGSWYHRLKILKEDGTTLYSKKGGFTNVEEAEESYRKHELEYARAYRNFHAASSADFDLKDYLIYWLEEIYSPRIENTTRMVSAYTLYDLILPNLNQSMKLKYVNVEFLDALLEKASKACKSAGNICREFLNLAMKDALVQGYISSNPVPLTKPYKRKKPNVIVLNKQEMRVFLEKAAENSWYLEILLGLFMGLRKGEIAGLKFSDFNFEKKTVSVSRQITSNPIVLKGQGKISEYQVIEREPKTSNSYRTLKVPDIIIGELQLRKAKIELNKAKMGEHYIDKNYISCCENGVPHATASFNTALTKLCKRSGLPHLTVHGLRHMYASILTEQGVPLVKVSALLGHASVHTTFEYYCEVMDEDEKIRSFLNNNFT